MKNLIDEREPITLEDVARAQSDAEEWLEGCDPQEQWDGVPYLVRRLLAITDQAYGRPL